MTDAPRSCLVVKIPLQKSQEVTGTPLSSTVACNTAKVFSLMLAANSTYGIFLILISQQKQTVSHTMQ